MNILQEKLSEESVRSMCLALLYVAMGLPGEGMDSVFTGLELEADEDENLIREIKMRTFDGREWVLRMELQ